MKLITNVTDNVEELLCKIIEFTETREKVITDNIKNYRLPGFVPKDLPVDEFADAIDTAIGEHIKNERLMLCDSGNVRFAEKGRFVVSVIICDE